MITTRPGAPLTPRQHAVVRRQLALMPAYGWAVYMWSVFVEQLPIERSRTTAHVFRDFIHFYILGLLTRVHAVGMLYDPEAQRHLMLQVVPTADDILIPTSYGPYVGLLFAPISGGTYVQALLAWIGISLVLYVVCMYALWRLCPNLADRAWPFAVLAAGAPAFHFNLMYAQIAILEMAPVIGVYAALRVAASGRVDLTRSPRRQLLAGLILGLLFLKPHLALGAAVLVIGGGQWWIAAGAAVSIVGQLLVAAAYWGPRVIVDYGHALVRIPTTMTTIEPDIRHLHEWRAFFQVLGVHGAPLSIATIVASIVTLGVALTCWRSRGDLRLRYGVLLVATTLVSPHLYTYDLMILMPAGFLLWDFACDSDRAGDLRGARAIKTLVLLGYAAPLFGFLVTLVHVQLSVPLLAGTGVFLTLLTRPARRVPLV